MDLCLDCLMKLPQTKQNKSLIVLARFTAEMPTAYCSLPKLHRLLMMLPSPERWVINRSTPGYTQAKSEKTEMHHSVCIKLRDCLTGHWAQWWFDSCWDSEHPVCITFIQIRPPMGEILCWALVRYSSQSRWLTIDMQGSLSNAGAILQHYRQQGKRVDGV